MLDLSSVEIYLSSVSDKEIGIQMLNPASHIRTMAKYLDWSSRSLGAIDQ